MRADQDHSGVAILPLSPTHRTALALTIAGACFLSPTLAGRVQARDDAGVHAFSHTSHVAAQVRVRIQHRHSLSEPRDWGPIPTTASVAGLLGHLR
jgi:hypothetical protein